MVLTSTRRFITIIDISLSHNLGDVSEESSHPLKERDVGQKIKRFVSRELSNRRKRYPTDGWRLNDT